MKGTYVLLLKLEKGVGLKYGKKTSHLEPGYYAYVGSAMGGFFRRIPRYFSVPGRNTGTSTTYWITRGSPG